MIAPTRFLAAALALLATGPARAESWRVSVRADADIKAPTFALAEVKAELPEGTMRLSGETVAWIVESFRSGGRAYLALTVGPLKAGEAARYELTREERDGRPAIASDRGAAVPITWAAHPFVTYRTDQGTKPIYFPVIGPSGAPFTRSYPMVKEEGEDTDHNHQRSMWFTHGAVNGVDFWASDPLNKPSPKFGTIKETARKVLVNGTRVAVMQTADDWLGPDGKLVCQDERTVLFSGSETVRVIDFDVTLRATAGPVTFGDTKEGMFGLRVASSLDVKRKQGGKITNAEGITDNDAWGKPSAWVDYTGPVAGQVVGIAILNHPESFRYPTTWHVRDYGLFAANPFGWHDFGLKKSGDYTLPAGASIRFRYRVLLHQGDTASADIPSAFQAYTRPPKVTVEKE